MPLHYARYLVGHRRHASANRQLGCLLALNAGALNAGGFLAVQQYTSHLTGAVSAVADNTVLGRYSLALDGLVGVLAFLLGAAVCALLVNHGRRQRLRSEYARPLLLEAALILVFGLLGARLATDETLLVPATVLLLCFTMGLQNALVTKLSQREIRTTHMTGVVTDLGIEIGKALYWNRVEHAELVQADRARIGILASLFACFLLGGLLGAWGFKHIGYGFTLPLALLLAVLAAVPTLDDLLRRDP